VGYLQGFVIKCRNCGGDGTDCSGLYLKTITCSKHLATPTPGQQKLQSKTPNPRWSFFYVEPPSAYISYGFCAFNRAADPLNSYLETGYLSASTAQSIREYLGTMEKCTTISAKFAPDGEQLQALKDGMEQIRQVLAESGK